MNVTSTENVYITKIVAPEASSMFYLLDVVNTMLRKCVLQL